MFTGTQKLNNRRTNFDTKDHHFPIPSYFDIPHADKVNPHVDRENLVAQFLLQNYTCKHTQACKHAHTCVDNRTFTTQIFPT